MLRHTGGYTIPGERRPGTQSHLWCWQKDPNISPPVPSQWDGSPEADLGACPHMCAQRRESHRVEDRVSSKPGGPALTLQAPSSPWAKGSPRGRGIAD